MHVQRLCSACSACAFYHVHGYAPFAQCICIGTFEIADEGLVIGARGGACERMVGLQPLTRRGCSLYAQRAAASTPQIRSL